MKVQNQYLMAVLTATIDNYVSYNNSICLALVYAQYSSPEDFSELTDVKL